MINCFWRGAVICCLLIRHFKEDFSRCGYCVKLKTLWISSVCGFVLPLLFSKCHPKCGKKTLWFQCSVRKGKDFIPSCMLTCYRLPHTYFSSVKILYPPNSDKVLPINRFLYHYKVWSGEVILFEVSTPELKFLNLLPTGGSQASSIHQLLFRSYFCTALNPNQLLHVKAHRACLKYFLFEFSVSCSEQKIKTKLDLNPGF